MNLSELILGLRWEFIYWDLILKGIICFETKVIGVTILVLNYY